MRKSNIPGDLASRWQRLGAHFLDVFVVWLITVIPVQIMMGWSLSPELDQLLFWVPYGYWVACNIYGVSIGKRWLRIVIRKPTGRPPGVWSGLLRSTDFLAVAAVSIITGSPALTVLTFLAGLIGYAMLLWSPTKQTLYDRIAGTYVVQMQPGDRTAGFTF